MSAKVVITGLGVASAAGIGMDPLWEAVCEGRSCLGRIQAFDPAGFPAQIAGEVPAFKVNRMVPKSYRKATKVMARDIELAVVAADAAVRDAGIVTPGTDADAERTIAGERFGCHIGAGLIAAEVNELTDALVQAVDEAGEFDIKKWGSEGMNHLTPLWLLKYLPNMLACHVTIIHDAQGPSNTITCAEASGALSMGESRRVIFRGAADACFTGGGESRINPMGLQRQLFRRMLTTTKNDDPAGAVRPFDASADGSVPGEAAGILILERDAAARARDARRYAAVTGYAATTTPLADDDALLTAAQPAGIAAAMKNAIENAGLTPDDIDCVIPMGTGSPDQDRDDAEALKSVFGDALADLPIWCSKPYIGACGAASAAVDLALAARMIDEQKIPAVLNTAAPIAGLHAAARPAADADLAHLLVSTTSLGGQNVAIVLSRTD